MAKTVLTAPDISCEHCARAITDALSPVEGVRRVDVNIPEKQVRVDYDEGRVDPAKMRATLEEEGYPVASVTPVD